LTILFLLAGCLGQEGPETVTIQDVISDPGGYTAREVLIKGVTVEDMVVLRQGVVLIRMVDSSGARLSGIYTGNLYPVAPGDAASFAGVIKPQEALGGVHLGAPVFMDITMIKDVAVGGGIPSPPGTPAPLASQNPTIAQIIENAQALVDQEVGIFGTVTDVGTVAHGAETPLNFLVVDDGTGQIKVYAPQSQVGVGDTVAVRGAVSLEFGEVAILAGQVVLASGSSSVHGTSGGGGEAAVKPGEVARLEDGYTVEELITGRSALDGQEVRVRGKVVKVSGQITVPDIEGSFWFHIQDGTGDPAQGTNDLTVTYSGEPGVSVGDIVVVTGTLKADVELAAGYHFDALLTGATVEK